MTHSSLLQTNLLRAEHLRPNVTKHVPSGEILSSFLFLPLPSLLYRTVLNGLQTNRKTVSYSLAQWTSDHGYTCLSLTCILCREKERERDRDKRQRLGETV